MFKRFFLVLLIPGLLFARIERDYSFDRPEVVDNVVRLNGCRTMMVPFAPCVVVRPVNLLIPYGTKPVSFDVIYGDPVKLEGSYVVAPFRPGGQISEPPPADYFTRSSEYYEKNEFFPGTVRSEKFFTTGKNGHTIFTAKLFPVQYNPVTGEMLYYRKISVSVNTEATRDAPSYKCFPWVKSLLKLYVDNPEAVDKLPLTKRGPDDYDYLIVTTEALKNSFGDLISFNTRRGMRTRVQSISYVKANFTGKDDADVLRQYIADQYEKHNIVFVLLGEDDDNNEDNDIPHRGLHVQLYDYGTDFFDDYDVAGDLYFSCLDGTWQVAGSSYYGEPGSEDIGWEVYAARFAVDNSTELNNMINKTIKYSEQPVADEVKRNMLLGEHLWGPPDHPVDCWGKMCMVQFKGVCTQNNFTTTGFPTADWTTTELHDQDQTWSKSTLLSNVNDKKVTWIDHLGHSNISYILKLYSSDVTNTNFTNNGTNANFFLVYTQGCYPGSFDNRTKTGYATSDCIGEYFTAGISNGAVAFISNTRSGFGDDGYQGSSGHDGSGQRIHRYFHDALFGHKIHHAEMMNGYSKEVNKDIICDPDLNKPPYYGQVKWAAYDICILGDPALSIWSEVPQELQADHPDVFTNYSEFVWDTKKAYTQVALLNEAGDSIISSQLTGEDGKCQIEEEALTNYLLANDGKKMKINVKAHNFLPYQGEISIWLTNISNNDGNLLKDYLVTFNNRTGRTHYRLSANGMVNISIYNSRGALVKTVLNKMQSAGEHSITFGNSNLSNGIYYLKVTANSNTVVTKFVMTK